MILLISYSKIIQNVAGYTFTNKDYNLPYSKSVQPKILRQLMTLPSFFIIFVWRENIWPEGEGGSTRGERGGGDASTQTPGQQGLITGPQLITPATRLDGLGPGTVGK